VGRQDQEGRSALHYASDVDSKALLAEALVSAGADAQLSDFSGLTPLDVAQQQGARGVLAILERTQRSSRGLGASAMGACIPLSPLQVDVDEGLWSGGARAVVASPAMRASPGMAPLSPAAASASMRPQALVSSGRARTCGSPPAAVMCSLAAAGGWGAKSYVEEDIVTGRGEVWVARPLDVSSPSQSNDWGMRTVAIDPQSPAARRSPTAAMSAMAAAAPASEQQAHAPPRAAASNHTLEQHRVPGQPTDFSNWEEGGTFVASMVSRGVARAPGASVMDLTKSVTDDWIVVDSDDEDMVPFHRHTAGAEAAGGDGDAWQERVNQAKGAALQVKKGISNFWKSLAQ